MLQKGELQKDKQIFSKGFVATYTTGNKVFEKNDYFSRKLNKKCATNWAEIEKDKLVSLELYWDSKSIIKIDKAPSEMHKFELTPKDWFFSHKGYLDMGTQKVNIISRNIGYIENGILNVFSVMEGSGELIISTRVPS